MHTLLLADAMKFIIAISLLLCSCKNQATDASPPCEPIRVIVKPGDWRSEAISVEFSDAELALLQIRKAAQGKTRESLDVAIRQVQLLHCAQLRAPAANSDLIANSPIEDVFPLELVDVATRIGCGAIVDQNGRSFRGHAFSSPPQ